MKTPVTDNFFNYGREWAGVPSPNSALLFCRQMEIELTDSRKREALAGQTISIARQTISDQRKYIEKLEKEKFATEGGTEGRGASSLPSCPSGDICQTCVGAISNDCALSGAPQCCTECCRKSTAETMLRREVYGIIEYWQGASECNCGAETPIGACLKCDMEKLEDRTSELLLVVDSNARHNAEVTRGEVAACNHPSELCDVGRIMELLETLSRYPVATTYPDGPCIERDDMEEIRETLRHNADF